MTIFVSQYSSEKQGRGFSVQAEKERKRQEGKQEKKREMIIVSADRVSSPTLLRLLALSEMKCIVS